MTSVFSPETDPWYLTLVVREGNDVPTLLLRSCDTHPQIELDDITLDGRRQKVKLQVVTAQGNGLCSETRRKLCEGEGQDWWVVGGCFRLELHYCMGRVSREEQE